MKFTTPNPNNKFTFQLADGEELIRLEKGKFFWKNKEVKDEKKIYERFDQWLMQAEISQG